MIAISEHLRNHGFDPDLYQHTRIPYIWQKLKTYYNLEVIDERENFDEDETEDRYNEFSLPKDQFLDAMMERRLADPSEAPSSPAQLDLSPPPSPAKKRKRGETKTRGTSVEDTEDGTDAPSPAPKSKRGSSRQKKKATPAKAEKQEKAETTEEEDDDESEEEEEEEGESEGSGSSDEEESAEESGTQVSKSTRGAKKGQKPTTTKAKARPKRRR